MQAPIGRTGKISGMKASIQAASAPSNVDIPRNLRTRGGRPSARPPVEDHAMPQNRGYGRQSSRPGQSGRSDGGDLDDGLPRTRTELARFIQHQPDCAEISGSLRPVAGKGRQEDHARQCS